MQHFKLTILKWTNKQMFKKAQCYDVKCSQLLVVQTYGGWKIQ